ncbi:hypothetical protein F4778DRAFT_784822 [Xylariomycetidae sp. FL2044]|nr:hypothetical protein F4778DRAFT_784822 [Xylariomycetidae sp. FL2044]
MDRSQVNNGPAPLPVPVPAPAPTPATAPAPKEWNSSRIWELGPIWFILYLGLALFCVDYRTYWNVWMAPAPDYGYGSHITGHHNADWYSGLACLIVSAILKATWVGSWVQCLVMTWCCPLRWRPPKRTHSIMQADESILDQLQNGSIPFLEAWLNLPGPERRIKPWTLAFKFKNSRGEWRLHPHTFDKNPWDLGPKGNLLQVFGRQWYEWLFFWWNPERARRYGRYPDQDLPYADFVRLYRDNFLLTGLVGISIDDGEPSSSHGQGEPRRRLGRSTASHRSQQRSDASSLSQIEQWP